MDYKMIYLARRNPAIAPEEWPRAWRSHAVFASQFPVLGARISSLFYCARALEPSLGGLPYPAEASQAYDGAAIVASPSADSLDGEMSAEDRAKILADELRVFAGNTEAFTFHARETLVHGGAPGAAAVLRFLARRPGTSREAFLAPWEGRHAELAAGAADAGGAVRYVQDRLTAEPPPGYPFEAVAETWFASVEEAARSFSAPAFAAVAEDLAEFCDLGRSVALLTRVIHRWPRG